MGHARRDPRLSPTPAAHRCCQALCRTALALYTRQTDPSATPATAALRLPPCCHPAVCRAKARLLRHPQDSSHVHDRLFHHLRELPPGTSARQRLRAPVVQADDDPRPNDEHDLRREPDVLQRGGRVRGRRRRRHHARLLRHPQRPARGIRPAERERGRQRDHDRGDRVLRRRCTPSPQGVPPTHPTPHRPLGPPACPRAQRPARPLRPLSPASPPTPSLARPPTRRAASFITDAAPPHAPPHPTPHRPLAPPAQPARPALPACGAHSRHAHAAHERATCCFPLALGSQEPPVFAPPFELRR